MVEQAPTILCVDDDPGMLEVLSEYLTLQGFNVITAKNGVEAHFQVTRHRPKAVILDLFMPRLGGLGALDRIRRLDPEIQIILISGDANAIEMVTEAGVNMAGGLTKPLDLSRLLRLLVQAGVAPPGPAALPGKGADEARRRVRRRVLVVDDEPEVRGVLVEYLQGKGFDASGAGGGEEALRRLPELRPDVILLDISMHGLSGVETLARIKALPQRTCVVMVSGTDDMETAKRTLALGAADYVTKPVDFAYLDSVLELHVLMTQFDPAPSPSRPASS